LVGCNGAKHHNFIHVNADNGTEGVVGGASYEPAFVKITGVKHFPQDTSSGRIFQQMDIVHGNTERQAYKTIQSMTTAPVPLDWSLKEPEVGDGTRMPKPINMGRQVTGQQVLKDSKGQSKTLASIGKDQSEEVQGTAEQDDVKCTITCNGKPTSWGGWWPCWCVLQHHFRFLFANFISRLSTARVFYN
jgi:hypothetical protein